MFEKRIGVLQPGFVFFQVTVGAITVGKDSLPKTRTRIPIDDVTVPDTIKVPGGLEAVSKVT